MSSAANNRLIVVGYDGSEHAARALDWAAEEAILRGAKLHVVTAWHVPAMVYAGGAPPMVTPSLDESTRHAAAMFAEQAAERLREAGVDHETDVCRNDAGTALVEAAEHAELLVVGSRGHGDVAGLLLGSVGHHCTHHAPCPVVVVR
jgi:nucleotide-binding universal stress UspA family protein